jgi:hypothetical protein
MKNIIFAMTLLSGSAFAHTIVGTPVLKGALKTKVFVDSVETTCRIKVEKIKNILEEDSYGNPGYSVRINVSLDGEDSKRKIKIKADQDVELSNMFQSGNEKIVQDFQYASADGVRMEIDVEGRLKSVQYPYKANQTITCKF